MTITSALLSLQQFGAEGEEFPADGKKLLTANGY
jgi:hypothetical protein